MSTALVILITPMKPKTITQRARGSRFAQKCAIHRLLQVPKDMEWELKRYDDHTLHLVNTDIDDMLDVDDARIAAEEAEKRKQQQATAAAAGAGVAPAELGNCPAPESESTAEQANANAEVVPGSGGAAEKVDADECGKGDAPARPAGPSGRYYALCLHFTLPAAAYATMCLREITRQDTSTSFHSSLNALPAGQHPGKAAVPSSAVVDGALGGAGGEEEAVPKVSTSKGAMIKIGSSFS